MGGGVMGSVERLEEGGAVEKMLQIGNAGGEG
jgi:hypothetical protein